MNYYMLKREAKFNTEFLAWVKKYRPETAAYELKHTRGKSYLNYKEVREHQINALLACKQGTFVYKISDAGLAFKPFDCFSLSGVPAFMVIKYPNSIVGIDIDEFIRFRDGSKRKSLTEDEAWVIHSFHLQSNLR